MEQEYEGILVLHNQTYAIRPDDGSPIVFKKTPFLTSLIPGDKILYTRVPTPLRLLERTPQNTLAIVRGIVAGRAYLFCPLLGSVYNPSILQLDFQVGDRLLIRIPADEARGLGIIQNLGSIHDRTADIKSIEAVYLVPEQVHLPTAIESAPEPLYTQSYQDLRDLPTFSIDPAGSLDADDAITVLPEENRVLIHIVDIHSLLKTDSSIEGAAANLSMTLYLPSHTVNILPKGLAEHTFSLRQGEERAVITIDIRFNPDYTTVKAYDIYPSVIINKRAYVYEEALELLEEDSGNSGNPVWTYLNTFLEKSAPPRNISIPTLDITLDPVTQKMVSFRHRTNVDKAHKVIERLMVLANFIVSTHLSLHPHTAESYANIPQRFHTTPHTVANMPEGISNPVVASFIAIKSYATAQYDATQQGHFGLQLQSYTHFTSPIRRYFDVILHHMLAGYTYNQRYMKDVLTHLNKQERRIDALQKLYTRWKIIDWMNSLPYPYTAEAYVTKVMFAGIYYLLPELMLDGFIHTQTPYEVGTPIRIYVTKINVILGTLEFAIS